MKVAKPNWYVNCANCGRQVNIESRDDKCYFCGLPARKRVLAAPSEAINKKEDIMAKENGTIEAVPLRSKRRKTHELYFEQNKEAMLADYRSMRLLDFYKRWSVCSTTWHKLKQRWDIKSKWESTGLEPSKPPRDELQGLTEHEHYLVLFGYRMAVRELLDSMRKLSS